MAIVGNRDIVDSVLLIAFDDRAIAMQWASALIANQCYGDSIDGKPSGCDVTYHAPMRGWVVEANDILHSRPLIKDIAWRSPETKLSPTF